MKRFSLITLFLLTTLLSVSAFVDDEFEFTIIDAEKKSVSVKRNNAYDYSGIESLTIPATITYDEQTYNVTEIAFEGFRDLRAEKGFPLKEINLPEGLKVIGGKAFVGLYDIQGITIIPSTVDTIGEYAFADWVTPIQFISGEPAALGGTQVFRDNLKRNSSIIIPCGTYNAYSTVTEWKNCITRIEERCLTFEVESLKYKIEDGVNATLLGYAGKAPATISIPNIVSYNEKNYVVRKIGSKACKDSITIGTLTIGDSIIEIGASAFYNCTGLQSITFGSNLRTIRDRAFVGCTALQDTVIIPATVSLIEEYAFAEWECPICILSERPATLGTQVFRDNNKEASPIILPCGKLETYKTAQNWSSFSSRFVSACKPLKLTKGEALTQDTTVSSISFSRTFPMNQWQALYLPFEMESMLVYDDGYWDAYFPFNSEKPTEGGYFYLYGLKSIDTNSGLFTFQEVHELNSNTPYMMLFIDKNSNYFEDKEIVFKSKQGEYRLTDNYTEPTLGAAYQLHGNNSLWEHSLTDGYTLSSSCDSCAQGIYDYKFWFSHNDNAPVLPFSWVVTPTKDIASKIMPAPRFLAGRWGYQPSSGGGDTPTSMQTVSESKVTYTQTGSQLTLYTQGQPCKVYAIDGTLLLSTDGTQDEISIELNQGLYIIYSNGQSQKVLF